MLKTDRDLQGTRKKTKELRTTPAPPPAPVAHRWYDRHTPHAKTARAVAEDELLDLSPETPTTVLNLAGLWGGTRDMRNWVGRVAPSKEVLRNKVCLILPCNWSVSVSL